MLKKILIIAAAAVLLGGGIAGGYIYLDHLHKEEILEITEELEYYQETYDSFSIVSAYTVNENKGHGECILEEDLTVVDSAEQIETNLVTDPSELIGKYYKTDITAGTLLTYDNIIDYPLEAGSRSFDVIVSFNPVGLEVNDFVDIRFQTPMGEDFVAIAHKRVEGIYNNVLKITMTEYEILVYNSLAVDQALMSGSMIYTTKYIEPEGQDAAEEFYPISYDVMKAILTNPNINKDIDFLSLAESRFEMLQNYKAYSEDEDAMILQSLKNDMAYSVESAQDVYEYQLEQEYYRQLEEAALNGGG